jgi:quercetin dioxygenase-like cupin family protein
MELEIKSFDAPDETRAFDKGTFEVVEIGGMTIGRARYEPGWRWSEHVGPIIGAATCEVEHLGLVISGTAAVSMNDGRDFVMEPGDLFAIPPGHDSWVVGNEPYVSLHFLGAADYAAAHD